MTLKQGWKVKLDIAKDLQTTISNKLSSNSKPLRPMIREILGCLLCPPFDIVTCDMAAILFSKQGKN